MAVTAFQDYPLADRDREWDGAAAEKRVRKWAGAEDEPNEKYRDTHVWYDSDKKDNFTGYKLLIADVIDGKIKAVPRAVMAAGTIMQVPAAEPTSRATTSTGCRATSPSTTPSWAKTPPGSVTEPSPTSPGNLSARDSRDLRRYCPYDGAPFDYMSKPAPRRRRGGLR